MKAIIIALAVIILMIGAQSVSAEHTSNTMPQVVRVHQEMMYLASLNFPPGTLWAMRKVGQDNHLACDVINESDFTNGV